MTVVRLCLGAGVAATVTRTVLDAWPAVGCGLLVGRADGDALRGEQAVPAANVAADPLRRFEVDPAVRFRVERQLRAGGGAVLVGHFHSHPAGRPEPSASDLEAVHEPALAWLICGVDAGAVSGLAAWLPVTGAAGRATGFRPLAHDPGDHP